MGTGMISLWISFTVAGIIMPMIPYMTRKTDNFGVTIPEYMYNRVDFKKMRRSYAFILIALLLIFIIAAGVLSFYVTTTVTVIFLSISISLYVIASFLLYLPFHYKMKSIKRAEVWQEEVPQAVVVDTAFRKEKLVLSNWWFLIPGILTIATVALTFSFYDRIPDEIPMHEDFSGNVRYDKKSPSNLLLLPLMQVFMLGLFLGINFIIKRSKQQVSAASPERSKMQNILFRRRWSVFTIVSAVLMVFLFGYMQLSFIFPALQAYTDLVLTIIIVLILLGSILLSVNTGQGGSRIKIKDATENGKIDRDDDRYWKLGQFYVNKNDPTIFVEKRFGIGWTNNWAHPISWLLIIGIIAFPIIIAVILV